MIYAVLSAWGVEGVFQGLNDARSLVNRLKTMQAYRGTEMRVLEFSTEGLVQFRINSSSLEGLREFVVK